MVKKITSLRIKVEKLGAVSEVTALLYDLENAYNHIYAFNFIVDTLWQDRERRFKQADQNFNQLRKYWKDLTYRKDFPFDLFTYEMFFGDFALKRANDNLPNLIEIQQNIHIDRIVLPSDRLLISKVNIQSPGFWEVLGTLNPLQQIREYINDRHERKKDNQYRCRQEKKIGELEIAERENRLLNERIETLKSLGYSEIEIRQFVDLMVIEPLSRLGKHQDNGQIEGTDEQ